VNSGNKTGELLPLTFSFGCGIHWELSSSVDCKPWLTHFFSLLNHPLRNLQVNDTLIKVFFSQSAPFLPDSLDSMEFLDSTEFPEPSSWVFLPRKTLNFYSTPTFTHVYVHIHTVPEPSGILNMWMATEFLYWPLIKAGAFPLHAALVGLNQDGLVLCAPGGTGKSTCISRLPTPWVGYAEDEVLILPDAKEGFVAWPLPTWASYYRKIEEQKNLPLLLEPLHLKYICFLRQGAPDQYLEWGRGKVASHLFQSSIQVVRKFRTPDNKGWNQSLTHSLFNNIVNCALKISAGELLATKTGAFWDHWPLAQRWGEGICE